MKRRVLTIIVAMLLAVLGTTAVLVYVNKADARALEGKEAVTVLVASRPIPAGTTAKAALAMLRAEKMPAASVPSDVVSAIDKDLEALVTSTDMNQGQLLSRRMLVRASRQAEIMLPEGTLAVTIPIEAGSHGEGQLKSGFKVAVFNTFTVQRGESSFLPNGEKLAFKEGKNHATRLLLPMVEVIGVVAEKAKSKDRSSSGGFGKYLVTVAVTQSEAERLIHALNTGTVSLAQINEQSKVKPGTGVDNNHMFESGS